MDFSTAPLATGALGLYTEATGSGATVEPSSETPAHNNEIIFAACANPNPAINVSSPFTLDGAAFNSGIAKLVQTTATAENPTWQNGGYGAGAAFMASLY